MSHPEAVPLQKLYNNANETSKSMNSGVTVTNDALGFLNAVRVASQNNMDKYDQFLNILRDFISNQIYISDVKEKLNTSFMQKKHQITVSSVDPRALGFIQEVKHAIQHKRENNFHDFVKVVKDYGDQTIDLRCFTSRVEVLLKNHPDLILKLYSFELPKKHQITVSDFLQAVKHAIQYKREINFHDFLKVMKDYNHQTIDKSCFTSRVKALLQNHPDLILEFDTFLSSHNPTGKDSGHLCQLPWDVLDTICKTLDFEDLISFSGVCKNWRAFHKSNFVLSQEPLLVRIRVTGNCPNSYSFISIPNQKVYDLKMMSKCAYVRVSGRYFILAHKNNSFLLVNPFTRKKTVINATFTVESQCSDRYEALLAFEKYSEEYVLVVLCKESSRLYVYRSRSNGWFTCSTLKPKEVVVDFVVLNNIIYVVTNKANIGVLNLNSGNIQFLNLKNTPKKDFSNSLKLVNCDEQLLLFHSISSYYRREVYKIDLSSMNYVKMKTLGDIALFYVSRRNCRTLSNPKKFGYESNHVYEVSSLYNQCTKYDWNDGCL